MSYGNTDPTGRPLELKVDRKESEVTQEELKAKEEVHKYADKRLKQLVKSDEMYDAIEYFLLGDPERQIEQLGGVDSLLTAGDAAKSKPDYVKARYNYEAAGKIEMYRRNKEGLRKCLAIAQEVTDESDKHFQYQQTILDNIDEALSVSKEYYTIIPGSELS
jgi:hypothetical protein